MKSATAKKVKSKPFEKTEKNSKPESACTINRQAEVHANFSIEMATNTAGVSINQLKQMLYVILVLLFLASAKCLPRPGGSVVSVSDS